MSLLIVCTALREEISQMLPEREGAEAEPGDCVRYHCDEHVTSGIVVTAWKDSLRIVWSELPSVITQAIEIEYVRNNIVKAMQIPKEYLGFSEKSVHSPVIVDTLRPKTPTSIEVKGWSRVMSAPVDFVVKL